MWVGLGLGSGKFRVKACFCRTKKAVGWTSNRKNLMKGFLPKTGVGVLIFINMGVLEDCGIVVDVQELFHLSQEGGVGVIL